MFLKVNRLNLLFFVFSTFFLGALAIPANGQEVQKKSDDKTYIEITEKGTEYEVVGWETNVTYNPHTFTWITWEEPVVAQTTSEVTKVVPVSALDRPPVFGKACLEEKDKLTCSSQQLQEFVSDRFIDYPDQAQVEGQEGLEYVTFTLDENGNYEGKLKVLSKEKPCQGCAQAAVDIVASMEDQWYPAMKDGKPVKVQLTVPVRFELKGRF